MPTVLILLGFRMQSHRVIIKTALEILKGTLEDQEKVGTLTKHPAVSGKCLLEQWAWVYSISHRQVVKTCIFQCRPCVEKLKSGII